MIAFILPTVKQRLANNTSEKQPKYDSFHSTNCEKKIGKTIQVKSSQHMTTIHTTNCQTKIGKQYK